MKIKVNKDLTANFQMETVKEKAKEFKKTFSETELLDMYTAATDEYVKGEILKCECEAFACNSFNFDISVAVEMVVWDKYRGADFLRFYVDETDAGFSVNSVEILLTHEKYRMTA